jgi:uncharacterized protein with PIN domain
MATVSQPQIGARPTDIMELRFDNTFSLCTECTHRLQSIDKEEARGKVPPFVFSTQEQLYQCHKCGKLYWRGTHWRNMRTELARFT